jgi:hypothetical protein
MFFFITIKFIFLIAMAAAQFDLQFLGNFTSQDEETNQEFCETKFCLEDAHNLFSSTTQNASVRPCDDFKEFAVGNFIKNRVVSDRYQFNGFGCSNCSRGKAKKIVGIKSRRGKRFKSC